ncbi:MAG: hypothetical protein G3W58_22835 [Pantoea ananatis]|nr:hypothetical protein [Pantoea ananatis]
MNTYFYVIEWADGSGRTSGLVQALTAEAAFDHVRGEGFGINSPGDGDIVVFNLVEAKS